MRLHSKKEGTRGVSKLGKVLAGLTAPAHSSCDASVPPPVARSCTLTLNQALQSEAVARAGGGG